MPLLSHGADDIDFLLLLVPTGSEVDVIHVFHVQGVHLVVDAVLLEDVVGFEHVGAANLRVLYWNIRLNVLG